MFDYYRKIKVLLTKMNINTVNKQLEFSNKILLYGYNSMNALICCFSCNGLVLIAGHPRHIQSVFKLIVDILMDIQVV